MEIKNPLKNTVEKLPKTSGVYLFYEKHHIIYIGKAINIRSRVKNHFLQPSYRDNLFIDKVTQIDFRETDSEIDALVLEANLIKKHQPKFNVVWRDDKNYFYLAVAENPQKIPYVFLTHQRENPRTEYIGPFVEGNPLKKALKYLRRVFPFYTTAKHPKNQCTWCHLGLCPGPELFELPPSPEASASLRDYKKNIKKLTLVFKGKSQRVLSGLKKEMNELSKAHQYEEAAKKRDKLQALEQVMLHTHVIEQTETNNSWPNTQTVLRGILNIDSPISRLECYDISNIQGKNATGSMVVFIDGLPSKSQYKKFKIRMENEPNDIAMLKEVLSRRLAHPEWPQPEVMLIDGGIAQLNIAIKVKNTFNKNIKIISIAKGRQELFIEGRKQPIPLKSLPQEIYNLVKYLDDEAHRFAITFHKKLRKQALLT